jgi:ElaB/YqjD/DUF883 family membrane-anchored ribosome-binding protein
MTSGITVDLLEKRAADQRRQLHNSVVELRQSVNEKVGELQQNVKEKLDVKRNVREHLWPAAGAMAFIGLLVGYSVTGIFTAD